MKRSKFDSQPLGLISGLILPMISLVIFYMVRHSDLSPGEFLDTMLRLNILTQVISLHVIPNLLLFFIFIWKNYLFSARGVLTATFIFAGLVFLLKFST